MKGRGPTKDTPARLSSLLLLPDYLHVRVATRTVLDPRPEFVFLQQPQPRSRPAEKT